MQINTLLNPSAGKEASLAVELATTAVRAGDVVEAERLLRERVARAPNDANALAKLGEIALDQGRIEEATLFLRRAAVVDPSLQRRIAYAQHLSAYAGAAAALREIEAFPPKLLDTYAARALQAAMLGVLGMHEREIAIYERLSRHFPDDPALWMSLGNSLKTVGRMNEAVAALRKAITLRPTYGEGYWTLANFKAFQFTDADIAAMRKQLKGQLSDQDALHFHFALGKAFEDRNQYPASFRHYDMANRLRAKSLTPDAMSATPFINAAVSAYSADMFEQFAGAGCDAPDPIFVLGLHRSGSTLVEQILASHPLIEGTTEITVMQQLWHRLRRLARANGRTGLDELRRLGPEDIRQIGQEYMERTRPFRLSDKPFFVDKLPANWMNTGLIRLVLPNAKIIDARRHPMACCFSNFKQNYATGVGYSYSQQAVGNFYHDYWRFMAHIDQVQPGAVHRVINERLIEDPEGEVRRMLDYVGVPFDPACLDFHNNKRAVRTPSAEQVRRPINRDGVDYWRHYEPWLGPLKQALGPALDQWDQPPG